jgi:SNF2 family DNA or RNA helicase
VTTFLAAFEKRARLKSSVKLTDHQKRVVKRTEENDGSMLVAHATGSGKTLSGIAAFENLKAKGKANRAIVVVPAALRSNFTEKGIKQFTDSSYSTYGPKGEKDSKQIGDKSDADYNIISYDLFRSHGDKILADTGADTLIMDEIHRARGTEGATYKQLKRLRGKVKGAITLTGSIVNNEPGDVVPLLDVTYGEHGHELGTKEEFTKRFVGKSTKSFFGKESPKALKHSDQLGKYLRNKVDFLSHEDIASSLPKKTVETVETPMSTEQRRIYDFTMSSVDPITRWKIRYNIPVGQREASAAFGKLMQARQISTDPGVLSRQLQKQNPGEYSPKVKAMVEDAEKHLGANPKHKTVIFGNLLTGQLSAIEKGLKAKGMDYSKFYGTGNEGSSSKEREEALKDFQSSKKRVLLISGAGAEGLDLKDVNLMQLAEGHYNPERIEQAEARVRRLGSTVKDVKVKRYVSTPDKPGLLSSAKKLFGHEDQGIDKWIYGVAERKNELNSQFRGLLKGKPGKYDQSFFQPKAPTAERAQSVAPAPQPMSKLKMLGAAAAVGIPLYLAGRKFAKM